MRLSRGTRLGPYEIEAPLGAGGMGEVYRARDTRLDRVVAIKIIIDGDAASAAMRERFDREARAIALLSHPNICTLHDIGHHEGLAFLVMEYLEGETLADRLSRQKPRSSAGSHAGPTPAPRLPPTGDAARGPASRTPLPLDETIRIATQLADALTAAHRAGIVHRDLKPGNIMLTRSGVKVLDFGLAKLKPSGDVGVKATSTLTDLPLTGEGMLVGTIPYMAPEQLEGRGIDQRTDIFAFGGIVYEMATGRRAFGGESQASLIAAILDREPEPISADQPLTPPGLERLVRKCLVKDPDARWQAASDIADELRWLSTGGGSAALASPPPARRRRLGGRTLAAGVGLLASVAAVAVWRLSLGVTPPQAPRLEMTYTQATFAGDVSAAALSPDGRTVAYASGAEGHVRLFVRDLVGGQSLEIWKGALVSELGWLPNGSQLVVASLRDMESASELWLVSRLGGAPRLIAPLGARVAVSPDGSQLAHGTQSVAGFNLSALDGTETRQVRLQGSRFLEGLEWNSPTNRVLVLSRDDKGAYSVASVTPQGTDLRRLYSDGTAIGAMCSSPLAGVLYLFRDRHGAQELLKLAITAAEAQTATVLTSGLQTVSHLNCSVSADGERLLYVRGTGHANLWRLDLRRAASSATALTRGTSTLGFPRVSPDGQWIVASRENESTHRIVRMPLAGGEFNELATGSGAVWSPDGTRLAFVTGPQRVWVSDADGRAPQQVKGAESVNDEVTWLPDGRLAWPTSDVRNYRIRDLASGQEELLLKNPEVGWVFDPAFSPQGDQVAVYWNRTDGPQRRRGLWVLSWPAREERFVAPNLRPVGWSENGDWIYAFEDSKNAIVRVSPRTTKVEPVGTFPRGQLFGGSCSLTHDRQATICSLFESVTDAWIVDHFDPAVRGEQR